MPTYNVSTANLVEAQSTIPENQRLASRHIVVLEIVALVVSSLFTAATAFLAVCSWWGPAEILGMGDGSQKTLTSSRYETPFTPAPWAYAAWLGVFAMQALWVTHAWSFTCRQNKERAVSFAVHPALWLAASLNIGYVYAIGHDSAELSLALVGVETLVVYVCLAIVAVHLRKATTRLNEVAAWDRWAGHLLAVNGLSLLISWLTLLTFFHLGVVLHDKTDVQSGTVGTIILSLLAVLIVCYFLLEVTILDRYLRYALLIYPTIVWWLAATLVRNWNGEFAGIGRNNLFAFVLMVAVAALGVVRLLLVLVFHWVRPLASGGNGDGNDVTEMIPF